MPARKRFDPDRMAASRAAGAPAPALFPGAAVDHLTVTRLAQLIDGALKDKLPTGLKVAGEIGGFSVRTHWYFTLKDQDSAISAVMFASAAAKCRFRPGTGQRVLATGRVEFFAKQGRTQLYVTSMEPLGAGALDAQLRALIDEARALGWLDAARKRPLPVFPRRVAVVTSRTGAALQDVLDTMRRRCPAVEVAVVDVRVQGDGASGEVAGAIDWLSRNHAALGVDAVIVTRGGGSLEDLWCFNEREVARAVVSCAVPVVAAIGHETDTTLAELVADERAATPTQAAMRLTPDRSALLEQLAQLSSRSAGLLSRNIRQDARRLDALARHPALSDPWYALERARDRLTGASRRLTASLATALAGRRTSLERRGATLSRHEPRAVYAARRTALAHHGARLGRAVWGRLDPAPIGALRSRLDGAWAVASDRRSASLDALARALSVVNPLSILSRGYSVTTLPGGEVVRSVSQAPGGTVIVTRLSDGSVESVVADIRAGPSPKNRPEPRRGLAGGGTLGSQNQPGLF